MCVDNLSPQYVSIIDRTLRELWAKYEDKVIKNKDVEIKKPSLDDFADLLAEQNIPEAESLALALGIYTKDGTYNLFSKASNINMNNRLIAFNIRDLSEGLKTLGMFVILETLWSRIKRNFEAGKRTWIFIDEIYLMFANDYCINFFYTLWKRARKYGAILTGITQNVEDLLHNEKIGTYHRRCCQVLRMQKRGVDYYSAAQQLFRLEITFRKIMSFIKFLHQILMKLLNCVKKSKMLNRMNMILIS